MKFYCYYTMPSPKFITVYAWRPDYTERFYLQRVRQFCYAHQKMQVDLVRGELCHKLGGEKSVVILHEPTRDKPNLRLEGTEPDPYVPQDWADAF